VALGPNELKAVSKTGKQFKLFTLRSFPVDQIVSRECLKAMIKSQLHGDLISGDFDVGYVNGSSVISIRALEDLTEFWSATRKGSKNNAMV
jgi:hypothetical protein